MADTDPIARKGTLLDRLRAANANKPKPDLSHLDDPGLWKRIGLSEAVDVDDGEELEPVKPQRKRKPQIFRERDITRAIAGHMKAGLAVAGTKIDKAGNIIIITGRPEAVNLAPSDEQTEPANEWDTRYDIAHEAAEVCSRLHRLPRRQQIAPLPAASRLQAGTPARPAVVADLHGCLRGSDGTHAAAGRH